MQSMGSLNVAFRSICWHGGVAELLGGWLAVASVCGRLSEALVKLGFCIRWLVGADRDISAISDR